jgi:protocatechuate 3,4-dioxygenase beta subunit
MILMRRQQLTQTLVLIALSSTLTLGQQETGSLSGHIYCADTQQPARVAHVVLVLLPPAGTLISQSKVALPQPSSDTRMDGTFTIPHVPPGDYYLTVTYSGYLSPEYQFSEEELLHPTLEIRKRIDQSLPTVTIAAGKISAISVGIHRGAAITGVVRYEDGSPVPETEVEPLIRDSNGKWKTPPKSQSDQRLFGGNYGTDDRGHFRIHELPPGEYSLKLLSYTQGQGTLTIYFGDSFFEKDAKPIKLGEGEESSGDDITIRLSKLRHISGALINPSGQPINSGHIELLTAPEGIVITRTEVNFDDSTFRLDLVPEGSYIARVTRAADVRRPAQYGENVANSPEYKEAILQSYGDYEVPIEVLSDIPSLALPIPFKSATRQSIPSNH